MKIPQDFFVYRVLVKSKFVQCSNFTSFFVSNSQVFAKKRIAKMQLFLEGNNFTHFFLQKSGENFDTYININIDPNTGKQAGWTSSHNDPAKTQFILAI